MDYLSRRKSLIDRWRTQAELIVARTAVETEAVAVQAAL
jgi:hypothetical protein